jgi:hypothetical protein
MTGEWSVGFDAKWADFVADCENLSSFSLIQARIAVFAQAAGGGYNPRFHPPATS